VSSEPLTKISRFGNLLEIVKFSRPHVATFRPSFKPRRKRSKSTYKWVGNLYRVKRRIRRSVAILTQMMGPPAFVSFTYQQPDGTPILDMQKALQDWRIFTRRLKRKYPTVAFIRVPERQKSGSVHFHAAMFGLPSDLPCIMKKNPYKNRKKYIHDCPPERQCERKVRALGDLWGKGFVDAQVTRSPEAIGAYISSYLTKGDPDWTLFGNHLATSNDVFKKKIIAARQAGIYWELSTYKQSVAVDFVLEDLKDRMELRKVRQFETKWLGDATFEVYFIPSEDIDSS